MYVCICIYIYIYIYIYMYNKCNSNQILETFPSSI